MWAGESRRASTLRSSSSKEVPTSWHLDELYAGISGLRGHASFAPVPARLRCPQEGEETGGRCLESGVSGRSSPVWCPPPPHGNAVDTLVSGPQRHSPLPPR